MTGLNVGERIRDGELKQRRIDSGLLLFFCVFGAFIRAAVAYNSGIWADEGAFLLLAGSPSWSAMIQFLRFHESHPPLFYALMRVWMALAGSADVTALALPVAIGIAIIPAVFVCASRIFSTRAAIVASLLATFSPALVEYSTQLRPYGLLPLLTLASCYNLVTSIDKGGNRRWGAYVVVTTLLVYTHNWAWLILFGQAMAAASLFVKPLGYRRARLARELFVSWIIIGALYLPWFTTLLYQSRHAGHAAIVIGGFADAAGLALFALPSAAVMVLFGSLSQATAAMWIATFALMIGVSILIGLSGQTRPSPPLTDEGGVGKSLEMAAIALRVFAIVPVAATVAGVALSPRTDLLIPRCLAMLTPLVLIAASHWVDGARYARNRSARSQAPVVLLAGVAMISIFGVVTLIETPRSNAREVAAEVGRLVLPSDLVIIAPEWYAASFNHYFLPSATQIDYPHPGRGGLVDFSDVFTRVSDPKPLALIREAIDKASHDGRRVWLISGRHYVNRLTDAEFKEATVLRQAPKFSIIRVQQIRSALQDRFGDPDTSMFIRGRSPRNEDVIPFLYSLKPTASGSHHLKSASAKR